MQTHNPLELPRPDIHIKPDVSPPQARRRTSISHSSARMSLDAHSSISMKPTLSIQTAMVSCFAMPILAVKPTVLAQTHCHQVPICQFGRIWCSGRWGPLGWGWRKMQRRKKDKKLREKSGIWRVIFLTLGFVACHVSFIGVKTWENWRCHNGRGAHPFVNNVFFYQSITRWKIGWVKSIIWIY